jgi:hypothetical protein
VSRSIAGPTHRGGGSLKPRVFFLGPSGGGYKPGGTAERQSLEREPMHSRRDPGQRGGGVGWGDNHLRRRSEVPEFDLGNAAIPQLVLQRAPHWSGVPRREAARKDALVPQREAPDVSAWIEEDDVHIDGGPDPL